MCTNIILLLVFLSVSLFPPDHAYSQASSSVDAAWRGDLNENGDIDIFDLLGLLYHLPSPEFQSDRKQRIANVDRSADGKINEKSNKYQKKSFIFKNLLRSPL